YSLRVGGRRGGATGGSHGMAPAPPSREETWGMRVGRSGSVSGGRGRRTAAGGYRVVGRRAGGAPERSDGGMSRLMPPSLRSGAPRPRAARLSLPPAPHTGSA